MKTNYFFQIFLLSISATAIAQNASAPKQTTPPVAYYQILQSFDPKSGSKNEELDSKKFPYDAAAAEKRLSLKPYYLEGITINDFKIPEPPANSSDQTRAELNYLLTLQNHRSNYDVQSSLAMAGIYYNPRVTPADSSYSAYRQNLFHIGRSIGSWFNPDNMPQTAELMANVWRDASYFIWGFKYKYLRVRPYVLEPGLENLEETNWAAYPSGHAANSYINAYVYQELSPENREVFLRDAYDMAHSREILGVHFPSDSESGRMLARQFVDKLFSNKKFMQDLEKVKAEWSQKSTEDFSRPVEKKILKPAPSCGTSKSNSPSSCAKKCQ
jgi:acid phosphatase (class A)